MPGLSLKQRLITAARAFSEEIFRRRFSLHLTIEGWCMVGAMMLIGLAALQTAAPLLYLMFSMLCAFFILSALLATNTIRGIRARRVVPHVWVAQQTMRGELRIENRKRFTSSYSLRVQDVLTHRFLLGGAFFDRVQPGKEAMEDYHVLFLSRGIYKLESLEVATRYPFGLIERRLHFVTAEEILVLPQTIEINRVMAAARSELGEYEANVKGRGTGLYGLRAYTPDLPARDIHWKVSARRGNLIVREYESEEKRRACVILDNRSPQNSDEKERERFEKAVVLTATAIEWLCQHDHEVELRTASGIVGFGTGNAHLTRCRRALAALQLLQQDQGDPALLLNPEPGIVRFPILMYGYKAPEEGRVPLALTEFEEELEAAFAPPETSSKTKVLPRMF